MMKMFDLKRLVLLGAAAVLLPAASASADDKTNYITAREITAMVPCTATFANRLSEYSGSFTNADGKRFVLGDPRGECRFFLERMRLDVERGLVHGVRSETVRDGGRRKLHPRRRAGDARSRGVRETGRRQCRRPVRVPSRVPTATSRPWLRRPPLR